MSLFGGLRSIATNVEAMTSKGLRSETLSTDTKLDVNYNVELTTKTFIGYSLCYRFGFYCQIINNYINAKRN